jgi:hypothetical protein
MKVKRFNENNRGKIEIGVDKFQSAYDFLSLQIEVKPTISEYFPNYTEFVIIYPDEMLQVILFNEGDQGEVSNIETYTFWNYIEERPVIDRDEKTKGLSEKEKIDYFLINNYYSKSDIVLNALKSRTKDVLEVWTKIY